LRTKVWFASLKVISGLPSAYAIEMAVCPAQPPGKSDGGSRPRKFAAYARGQRVPQRKIAKPAIVDLAETCFPGSAAAFDCPLWDLLVKNPVDHEWFHDTLGNLLFTSKWPARIGRDPSRPRQFCDDPDAALTDFLARLEKLTIALLFWRVSETVNSIELRQDAIDTYLKLQPQLEASPELAGNLAAELFDAIDKNFPHWVYSGHRRIKVVVLTNELRVSRGCRALVPEDIDSTIRDRLGQ